MPRILALGDCAPLSERLEASGYEVLRAPGTTRALGLAQDLLPELVLVREAHDFEVTANLVATFARDAVTRFLPVVLLAEKLGPEILRRGLEAGAVDVLEREGDGESNQARLGAVLRGKHALDERVAEKQRATVLELAGAVSHQINQPLTAMSVILETLVVAHAREELSRERLGAKLLELERLVERMARMVKRISRLAEYRTVEYLGDVRILDLEDSSSDVLRRGPGDPERRGR